MRKINTENKPRGSMRPDPLRIVLIVILTAFLCLFLLYPLVMLLADSIWEPGRGLTLNAFSRVLDMRPFRDALSHTVILGLTVGAGATVLGFLFAYLEIYIVPHSRFTRGLFQVVSLLPIVSPPFVLSLSMILFFGRGGMVTRGIFGIYDSNIYGFHGIAIVQIMTFFPVCYLILAGQLRKIDPAVEEAARNLGAGRVKVFLTVTLPLILPAAGNAMLVTFIESAADFANPMVLGGSYETMATYIYLLLTGGTNDKSAASAISIILLMMTVTLFLLQKIYLERKARQTVSGKPAHARIPVSGAGARLPIMSICTAVGVFVMLMYLAVPFGALFKLWGRDYSLVGDHFAYIFRYDGMKVYKDSLVLSLIAAPCAAVLSILLSALVSGRRSGMTGFLEFVPLLAMAVPGTILGVSYIRGFSAGVFNTGFMQGLYGTWMILVIVLVLRSLPLGLRTGTLAIRQIDRSIPECARNMGAGSARVFRTITLPLIKDAFVTALMTAFVRSITAISAVILLVTPEFLLITVRINEYAEKGSYGEACAYATILILITFGIALLMKRLLHGGRMVRSGR